MPEKRDNRRFFERAKDTYDSAAEKIIDARDKTKETIQEHPFTSVIVAAAVGAIAGVAAAETIRMIRRSGRK
jgi:ElaB/YqjD/DUF883 family membrane-anchored ribosome-binding protein